MKSITVEMRVWYDEKSQDITLAAEGMTVTTVRNDPTSTHRYHPNLFRKLATALHAAGAPAPELTAN